MRPVLPLLLACAVLAIAAPARAQRDPGQAVRLTWPVANVLVYPDSESGVGVWVATNVHAVVDGRRASREAILRLHPDSLTDWLIYTRQRSSRSGSRPPRSIRCRS